MENFSLPSALHGFLTEYCSFSPHMLLSTVQCLVQVFPASLQKCANLENLEQRNIFIIMVTIGCVVQMSLMIVINPRLHLVQALH